MELANIKSYQRTIASVDLPLKHFIETGFWNPFAVEGWTENDIGDTFVRRACRQIASDLRRPFIQCYAGFMTAEEIPSGQKNKHGHDLYKTVPLPAPRFSYGFVEIPKQKRLAPLVAPLLLVPSRYDIMGKGLNSAAAYTSHLATLWQIRIQDQELWNQYYDFVLNDPECRAARRLTH